MNASTSILARGKALHRAPGLPLMCPRRLAVFLARVEARYEARRAPR